MTTRLLICINERLSARSCSGSGSQALARALETGVTARGLSTEIIKVHCFGRCAHGPALRIAGDAFRLHVDMSEVPAILDRLEHLENNAH